MEEDMRLELIHRYKAITGSLANCCLTKLGLVFHKNSGCAPRGLDAHGLILWYRINHFAQRARKANRHRKGKSDGLDVEETLC